MKKMMSEHCQRLSLLSDALLSQVFSATMLHTKKAFDTASLLFATYSIISFESKNSLSSTVSKSCPSLVGRVEPPGNVPTFLLADPCSSLKSNMKFFLKQVMNLTVQ